MKISTNFARPVHHLALAVAVLLWFSVVAIAAATWGFVHDAARLRAETPMLTQRLAAIKAGPGPIRVQSPSRDEFMRTRERVARLNAITETRGGSTLLVLSELEAVLPPDVWLTNFRHRAREGEVLLVAEAASTAPLSRLLSKLEQDPLFENVLLTREVHAHESGRSGIEFEIRLKVRA